MAYPMPGLKGRRRTACPQTPMLITAYMPRSASSWSGMVHDRKTSLTVAEFNAGSSVQNGDVIRVDPPSPRGLPERRSLAGRQPGCPWTHLA